MMEEDRTNLLYEMVQMSQRSGPVFMSVHGCVQPGDVVYRSSWWPYYKMPLFVLHKEIRAEME
jgi:hypothetical protein